MSEEKRKQVAAQCNAVNYMAVAIARVHGDYALLFQDSSGDKLIEQVGRRTAAFMEQLGDMLNAMDACTEDDDWMAPVFKEAQRLWPVIPNTDFTLLAGQTNPAPHAAAPGPTPGSITRCVVGPGGTKIVDAE